MNMNPNIQGYQTPWNHYQRRHQNMYHPHSSDPAHLHLVHQQPTGGYLPQGYRPGYHGNIQPQQKLNMLPQNLPIYDHIMGNGPPNAYQPYYAPPQAYMVQRPQMSVQHPVPHVQSILMQESSSAVAANQPMGTTPDMSFRNNNSLPMMRHPASYSFGSLAPHASMASTGYTNLPIGINFLCDSIAGRRAVMMPVQFANGSQWHSINSRIPANYNTVPPAQHFQPLLHREHKLSLARHMVPTIQNQNATASLSLTRSSEKKNMASPSTPPIEAPVSQRNATSADTCLSRADSAFEDGSPQFSLSSVTTITDAQDSAKARRQEAETVRPCSVAHNEELHKEYESKNLENMIKEKNLLNTENENVKKLLDDLTLSGSLEEKLPTSTSSANDGCMIIKNSSQANDQQQLEITEIKKSRRTKNDIFVQQAETEIETAARPHLNNDVKDLEINTLTKIRNKKDSTVLMPHSANVTNTKATRQARHLADQEMARLRRQEKANQVRIFKEKKRAETEEKKKQREVEIEKRKEEHAAKQAEESVRIEEEQRRQNEEVKRIQEEERKKKLAQKEARKIAKALKVSKKREKEIIDKRATEEWMKEAKRYNDQWMELPSPKKNLLIPKPNDPFFSSKRLSTVTRETVSKAGESRTNLIQKHTIHSNSPAQTEVSAIFLPSNEIFLMTPNLFTMNSAITAKDEKMKGGKESKNGKNGKKEKKSKKGKFYVLDKQYVEAKCDDDEDYDELEDDDEKMNEDSDDMKSEDSDDDDDDEDAGELFPIDV